MQRSTARALVLLTVFITSVVLLGGGCTDDPEGAPALTWAQLRDATYPSSVAPGEELQLVDGVLEEPVDGGTRPRARLADIGAFGEIDRGGSVDSAVFLVEAAGADDWVTSLVAVLNDDGSPVVQEPALLGQNVVVTGVTIREGEVTTRVRARDSVDRTAGTIAEITRTSTFDDDALEIRDESTQTVALPSPEDFTFEPTTLDSGSPGATIDVSIPPRRATTFVLHAAAGQELELNATSDFDSAILSVMGLEDEATIVDQSAYSTSFSGPVTGTQNYLVRILSVAGEDLDVQLSYELTGDAAAAPTPAPTPATLPTTELAAAVPKSDVDELAREQSLAALSPGAMEYIGTRAPARGMAVVTADEGLFYAENGDQQLETASVIKVVVMACTMHRAESEGRLVDEWELTMMWPMITYSDNDATDALWYDLGGGPAIASCLQSLGADGITPYMGDFWGTSTASARGIAMLMGRIAFGNAVNDVHRAVALEMLTSVIAEQRWGVAAGADGSGNEIVGVKDGWYPDDDGWRVNSVGFISPLSPGEEPYAIAVMTNNQTTQEYGIETIEGLALPVYEALRGP